MILFFTHSRCSARRCSPFPGAIPQLQGWVCPLSWGRTILAGAVKRKGPSLTLPADLFRESLCAHPAPRPGAVSMVSQTVLEALSTELSVLGCDRLNAAIKSFWRFLQHRIPVSTAWSFLCVCPASPCPIPACLGWLCSPRNLDPHSRRSGLMLLLHLLSPLPGPGDCCPSEGLNCLARLLRNAFCALPGGLHLHPEPGTVCFSP